MSTTASEEETSSLTGIMSEHEQLMWDMEKDPWLNPNGTGLVLLDKPVDMEHFTARIRHAVAQEPALTQRVKEASTPLGRHSWAPDADFDLDRHLHHRTLEAPGSERQLLDLATELYNEPLDRNHALWRFVVIDGLESGQGALWLYTHHALTDGIGQVEMSSHYYALSPDEPMMEPVDLDAVVAARVQAHGPTGSGPVLLREAKRAAGEILEDAREVAAEVMMWGADPRRISDRLRDLQSALRSTANQLTGSDGRPARGSELWKHRSAQRHLEYASVDLASLKASARSHGGSINDGFVAVMLEATSEYHELNDASLDQVRASFVLSTRKEDTGLSNDFTPVVVAFSGGSLPWAERIGEVTSRIRVAREDAIATGGVSAMAGAASSMPGSVITRLARAHSASIDFATSNIRGVPFPLYVSDSRVERVITQGPLAGTPCNATAMSTDGSFDVGLFTDPAAITDPALFRECVQRAFDSLVATG